MARGKWAIVLAVVLVLGAVAVAFAAGKTRAPEVIRAQRFELVDAEGRLRGVVGSTVDASVAVALYDEKGRGRAGLALFPDGSPGLVLFDEKGKPRATLALLPDSGPGLVLLDEKGEALAALP